MVWALTKANHTLSCNHWIRWWLRLGLLARFIVVAVVTFAYAALVFPLIVATTPNLANQFLGSRSGTSPFSFLSVLLWVPILFFVVDAVWDHFGTKSELDRLADQSDVVLATRGEYIGGHPKLPHGRFVYLTLGGTLTAPCLSILLPRSSMLGATDRFEMPVLEVEKTKAMLATVVSRDAVIGRKVTFQVEYTGLAGRKHNVELSHFFHGSDEVQDWRNYIVCIQAEADTGERPFGPWKSLPKGEPVAEAQPLLGA